MKYFIVRNGLCLKDELDIAWAEGDWLTGGWEREGSVPQKVCTGARSAGAIHSLCRVITQVYTLQNVCKDFTDTSSKQQTE